MKIKKLIPLRTIALVIGLFGAAAILLVSKPVLAAPSQCAVITPVGTIGPQPCSKKVDGVSDETRKFLSAAPFNDKCITITFQSSASNPEVKEANCTADEPFSSGGQKRIDRSNKNFSDCVNSDNPSSNCIATYINTGINVLSAGVVIIVIIMIIIGGIRYSSAGGDAQKVAGAKQQIFNALLALVAYIFLFTFLQWVVPGGWF